MSMNYSRQNAAVFVLITLKMSEKLFSSKHPNRNVMQLNGLSSTVSERLRTSVEFKLD